jgi:predicted RND superfamily exporter protein
VFAYLASKLTFESDLNAMLPKDTHQKDISAVLTHSKQLDKIIATLSISDSSLTDPDLLTSYVDEFAALLIEKDSMHLISNVETKQNEEQFLDLFEAVHNNLPFLLDENDYSKIDSLTAPENVHAILETNYKTLASPSGLAMKQFIAQDPIGLSYIPLKKLQDFKLDENTTLYDGYLMSSNQKVLTFFIHSTYPSSNTKKNEGLFSLLQSVSKLLKQKIEFKQIDFHFFGGQLVAAGNASQMKADTILTLSITILLLLLLFIFFFKRLLAPLQIMLPVLFGGLFGMAMMYLMKGKVSMISLGASSVILGIAVNY